MNDFSRLNVLLIDDKQETRNLIAGVLDDLEVKAVDVISDGADALAMLDAKSYDVVLCDGIMPGLSGLDLLKQIRSGGNHRDVFFVLMTGNDYSIDEAKKIGADGLISKPFGYPEVEQVLGNAVFYRNDSSVRPPFILPIRKSSLENQT